MLLVPAAYPRGSAMLQGHSPCVCEAMVSTSLALCLLLIPWAAFAVEHGPGSAALQGLLNLTGDA